MRPNRSSAISICYALPKICQVVDVMVVDVRMVDIRVVDVRYKVEKGKLKCWLPSTAIELGEVTRSWCSCKG